MKLYALLLVASLTAPSLAPAPAPSKTMHIGPFFLGMTRTEAEVVGLRSCDPQPVATFCKPDMKVFPSAGWAYLRFDPNSDLLSELRVGFLKPAHYEIDFPVAEAKQPVDYPRIEYLASKSAEFRAEVITSLGLPACATNMQRHESDLTIETDICFAAANQTRRISAGFNPYPELEPKSEGQTLHVWVTLRSDGGYKRYMEANRRDGEKSSSARK